MKGIGREDGGLYVFNADIDIKHCNIDVIPIPTTDLNNIPRSFNETDRG